MNDIIEAAYLLGFEPSADGMTVDALLSEAQEYLFQSLTK